MTNIELDQPPNRYAAPAVVMSLPGHRIMRYDMRGLPDDARETIAEPLASLVITAYRGGPIMPGELSDAKVESAINGIVPADTLSVLYDEGVERPTALLASTILTPESNPDFFNRLDFTADHYGLTRREAEPIRQLLLGIDGLFITDEMVVDYNFRKNGHSKALRQSVLDSLREHGITNVVMFGEIQNPSSIVQRLKYGNTLTVWAGQVLTGDHPRTDISTQPARIAADVISEAYVATKYPYLLPYYHDGIMPSEMFEFPAKMPETRKLDNPSIYDSLQLIVDRQHSMKSEDEAVLRGAMHTRHATERSVPFSGLAVTF